MDELRGRTVAILVEKLYEDLELWYPKLRLVEANPVSGGLRFELPDSGYAPARPRGGPRRDGRRGGEDKPRSQGRRGRPSNIRHRGR